MRRRREGGRVRRVRRGEWKEREERTGRDKKMMHTSTQSTTTLKVRGLP